MANSERIVLNEEAMNSLLERVSATQLEGADKKIITGILRLYQQIQFSLQEAKLSVKRLRTLFGFKTGKRSHLVHPEKSPEEGSDKEGLGKRTCDQLGALLSKTLDSLKKGKNSKKEKKKGHGRLGHKDYPGASVVNQEHESLKPGDLCPENCGGRVYAVGPKTTVCLTGHALASATKYLQGRCRCALCGKVFTAKPIEGMPSQKYDEALKANLAIAKNYAGMPFYRLQMLQLMVGVPPMAFG